MIFRGRSDLHSSINGLFGPNSTCKHMGHMGQIINRHYYVKNLKKSKGQIFFQNPTFPPIVGLWTQEKNFRLKSTRAIVEL